MFGEHARADELGARHSADRWVARRKGTKVVPIDFPGFALNRWSVRAFNTAYYLNGAVRAGTSLIDFDSYFYHLDAILEWNRIYGRRGFAQFQCLLPLESAKAGLERLLKEIARVGEASFLAVLKRMGAQQGSGISFPMEGYTLTLDFPIRNSTPALFDTLERIAIDHGGRFYLAKDSMLTASLLRQSDPRCAEFNTMRIRTKLAERFSSLQSERLSL
jgi:hypothetical protein